MHSVVDDRSLFLFETGSDEVGNPTLKDLVERGDFKACLNLIGQSEIDHAIEIVLKAGFSVYGGRRNKPLFYQKMGEQLLVACENKRLPKS